MEGILHLFQTVVESDWCDAYLPTLLQACSSQQSFSLKSTNDVQSVVAHINKTLNTPSTRAEGLLILKTFLPQCSADLFTENVVMWMTQCLKGCEQKDAKEVVDLSYTVMGELLEITAQYPQFTKQMSKIVPQLIVQFNKASEKITCRGLRCLESCMKSFPGPCGPLKGRLGEILLRLVNSSNKSMVKVAADCMALTPQIGGGGVAQVLHKKEWTVTLQKMIGTLHGILDSLYADIYELQRYDQVSARFELREIPDTNPVLKLQILKQQLVNMCYFIEALLINPFPVTKGVPPNEVLALVCRGLAVTCNTLGRKSTTEALAVGSFLPEIHSSFLRVLTALITCCQSSLLPYATLILKLVIQTLKWTVKSEWVYGVEKPYSELRCAAYESLVCWLRVSRGSSTVELVVDELMPLILKDVRVEKDSTVLVDSGTAPKAGKKRLKQNTMIFNQQIASTAKKQDKEANKDTCRAALQALQCLFHGSGSFVNPQFHKEIQEAVIHLLLDFQRSAHDQLIPYNNAECRKELYGVLQALVMNPNPKWPPPIQFAVHLFAQGQNDLNIEVGNFCTVALGICEKIIHPSRPSLQFTLSRAEVEGREDAGILNGGEELMVTGSKDNSSVISGSGSAYSRRKSDVSEAASDDDAPLNLKLEDDDEEIIDVSDDEQVLQKASLFLNKASPSAKAPKQVSPKVKRSVSERNVTNMEEIDIDEDVGEGRAADEVSQSQRGDKSRSSPRKTQAASKEEKEVIGMEDDDTVELDMTSEDVEESPEECDVGSRVVTGSFSSPKKTAASGSLSKTTVSTPTKDTENSESIVIDESSNNTVSTSSSEAPEGVAVDEDKTSKIDNKEVVISSEDSSQDTCSPATAGKRVRDESNVKVGKEGKENGVGDKTMEPDVKKSKTGNQETNENSTMLDDLEEEQMLASFVDVGVGEK